MSNYKKTFFDMDDEYDEVILSTSNSNMSDENDNENDIFTGIPIMDIESDSESDNIELTYLCDKTSDIIVLPETQNICCLCGKEKELHKNERHAFFLVKPEYRCKKCGLFFFQHNHKSTGCSFTPLKNLVYQ